MLLWNCNYPLHTKNLLILPLKCCKHPQTFTLRTLDNTTDSTPQLFPSRLGETPQAWGGLALWIEEPQWPLFPVLQSTTMTRNKHSCSWWAINNVKLFRTTQIKPFLLIREKLIGHICNSVIPKQLGHCRQLQNVRLSPRTQLITKLFSWLLIT